MLSTCLSKTCRHWCIGSMPDHHETKNGQTEPKAGSQAGSEADIDTEEGFASPPCFFHELDPAWTGLGTLSSTPAPTLTPPGSQSPPDSPASESSDTRLQDHPATAPVCPDPSADHPADCKSSRE